MFLKVAKWLLCLLSTFIMRLQIPAPTSSIFWFNTLRRNKNENYYGKKFGLKINGKGKGYCFLGAVVVAQLAARSLPIPEDPGSNPVINNYLLLTVCRKDENK